MVARKRHDCQQETPDRRPAGLLHSKSAATPGQDGPMPNHLIAGLLPPGHPPRQSRASRARRPRLFLWRCARRFPPATPRRFERSASEPGDRVAAQVEKSPEALFLYLGCVRAGAVFLPLNTAYTLAEVEYFVGDARPALLVARPGAARRSSRRSRKAQRRAPVETLAADGAGSLADLSPASAGRLVGRRARARRPRRDPLHLRHDRALQGRDADPREPPLQRRGAGRRPGASPPTTC